MILLKNRSVVGALVLLSVSRDLDAMNMAVLVQYAPRDHLLPQ